MRWIASLGTLLLALCAARFPDVPLLSYLPAVSATVLAVAMRRERGVWMAGLLPAAFFTWLPGSLLLACATAVLPPAAALVQRFLRVRTAALAAMVVPVVTYLAAAAASASFSLPFSYPLDLCAALVFGGTLTVIAYAPTQTERLGPRGRAGFRVR